MNKKNCRKIILIALIFIIVSICIILVIDESNNQKINIVNGYADPQSSYFDLFKLAELGQAARGLSSADFNHDEKMDFVVTYADSPFTHSTISIFYNNGNLKFTRDDIFTFDYNYINDIVAGDFNNDGNIDLLLTYNEWKLYQGIQINVNGSLNILFNDGNNTFSYMTMISRQGSTIPNNPEAEINRKVTSADYDMDGSLDFLVGDNSGKIELYENDGTGRFTSVEIIYDWGAASWGVTSSDFDSDGDADFLLAVAEIENHIKGHIYLVKNQILPSNLSTRFKLDPGDVIANISGTPATGSLAPLDYEQDGDVDFVFGASNHIYLYLINESREYENFPIYKLPNSPDGYLDDLTKGALATADFNNDGYDDFVAGGVQGVIRLFINNHSQNFS